MKDRDNMSEEQTPMTDDQVKRYATFDMITNSAIYAMANDDKIEYEKIVLDILNTVMQSQEITVSYICYLIAIYGQTLKMFTSSMNTDVTDLLTDASLFDVLAAEDPNHFHETERDLKDNNGS
jgi:hypothetical protein